jgi:MSHA biogenesis protein MshM
MIRAFYGISDNPFSTRNLKLLPPQQEIHDTLRVHCQQGGVLSQTLIVFSKAD